MAGRRQGLLAAVAEQVAQSAVLAHAIEHGEDDGQIAAADDPLQQAAVLRAEEYEQKDQDPQAAVAARICEAVH